jgi:hypothetical protein
MIFSKILATHGIIDISVGVILCNKQNFIGKRAAIYVEITK